MKIYKFGKTKNSEISILEQYYAKLLSKYTKFEIVTLKDPRKEDKLGISDIEKYLKLQDMIVLTEHGKEYTTIELSQYINKLRNNSIDVNFLIGTAYGFQGEVYKSVKQTLSLSKLTFTHEFVNILLLEQLYRCFDLQNNGRYHR